jgi:RNA polymerase sigma-70 factor (ECF subfamily)
MEGVRLKPADDRMAAELLRRASERDESAVGPLLDCYRDRVRKLVTSRMDRRLSARVDPSDVVQETLLEAGRRLPEYLREPAVAFYPWLRGLAVDRLIDLHRRHVGAQGRSVGREEPLGAPTPDGPARDLAALLVDSWTGPGQRAEREEQRQRVQDALGRLDPCQRELLTLLYYEELPPAEVAAALGVTDRTARRRHREALERLGTLLGETDRR